MGQTTIRKVAGYARVSTDHEDRVTSYQAQVDYYTRYINDHAEVGKDGTPTFTFRDGSQFSC